MEKHRNPPSPIQRIETLGDLIATVSPRLEYPHWLQPLVDILDRAMLEPIRAVVNVPPQHGKTETILHWLALMMLIHPERTSAYVSYGIKLSRSKSLRCRRYARRAGVELLDGMQNLEEWRTTEGGGLLATGIGGSITGEGVDGVLLIDDPIKGREEANSPIMREKTMDSIRDELLTRIHPTTSVILNMTRWHIDDPAGHYIREGWHHVKLPAVTGGYWDEERKEFTSGATALWEQGRPLTFLANVRRDQTAYGWASLYDQEPRPRGGAVFEPPTTCRLADVPRAGRYGIGVDLAYTEKTHSDYSGRLVMLRDGERYYVVDVLRRQCKAPDMVPILKNTADRYLGAPMVWHAGGTEIGAADFIKRAGVPLDARPATKDKLIRSEPVAAKWNDGAIYVPTDAPWSEAFLREVLSFTGVGDVHDDQVDMLSSAFGTLQGTGVDTVKSYGRRRMAGVRAAY